MLVDLLYVATYSKLTKTAKNNGKEGLKFVSIGIRLQINSCYVKPLRLYLQALVDVEGKHCCHFNRH